MRPTPLILMGALALAGCDKLEQTRTTKAEPPKRAAVPEPQGKATIPIAFRGEWNLDPANCGSSEGRLIVGPAHVQFFESRGLLDAVEPSGPNAVDVSATVKDATGEWTLANTYTLSNGGRTLTLAGAQGQAPVMQRCPGSPA